MEHTSAKRWGWKVRRNHQRRRGEAGGPLWRFSKEVFQQGGQEHGVRHWSKMSNENCPFALAALK